MSSAPLLDPGIVNDLIKNRYLLTWNCKHLANAQIARRIALVCEKPGHRMPIICTPEGLMGE